MGGCLGPGGRLGVHPGRQMEVPLLLACSRGYFLKLPLLCLNHIKLIPSRGWPRFSGLTESTYVGVFLGQGSQG